MRGPLKPLFLIPAIVIAVADLWSKAWAWDYVEEHGRGLVHKVVMVWDPYFRLVKAENTGTVWGLFQNATGILIVVRCVMAVVLTVLAARTPRHERLKLVGFGLVLGGALGNLYDNLFRENGAVRDFLDFHIPLPWQEELWHYPTFNVADSSILCGAVLLFIAFSKSEEPRPAASETEPVEES